MKWLTRTASFVGILGITLFVYSLANAACEQVVLSQGQTVYVPVYSNVFSTPKQTPFYMATILSIRNTDMTNSLTLLSADYYDTKGKLLKKSYQAAVTLAPLESTYLYLPEEDKAGGFGANYIVKWTAQKTINAPIIECVMIGTRSGQGISFISPGQVIQENTK